jgi:hypothetical protein
MRRAFMKAVAQAITDESHAIAPSTLMLGLEHLVGAADPTHQLGLQSEDELRGIGEPAGGRVAVD